MTEWQKFGNDLRTGKPVSISHAFRLFREAANERVRSIISGTQYEDFVTGENKPFLIYRNWSLTALSLPGLPLLDNWESYHPATSIPVTSPDIFEVVPEQSASLRIIPARNRPFTRKFFSDVYDRYNFMRHFVFSPVYPYRYYCEKNYTGRVSPVTAFSDCAKEEAINLPDSNTNWQYPHGIFRYEYDPETDTTKASASRTVILFERKEVLKGNDFIPETFTLPVTFACPAPEESIFAAPEGILCTDGSRMELHPPALSRQEINNERETVCGEYICPLPQTDMLYTLQGKNNIYYGYRGICTFCKQKNELSAYCKLLDFS